jgi:predicted Zn-dependent protease
VTRPTPSAIRTYRPARFKSAIVTRCRFRRRTLKIAIHETGHMFGMRHCTLFDCGMNGANHQDEADRHPIWFLSRR